MKKKFMCMIICLCMLVANTVISTAATTESIVILYENDVHCAVDGYSKLAAMKAELATDNTYVGVVSSGDFIQGASLGTVSQGEYIIELMNLVGYDAIGLGNHEFDYKIPRLLELVQMMNTKPVCSNFVKLGSEKTVFEPYSIVSYGDTDIAYIGVTTPHTLTSSSPAQFKDENGEYIYSFSQNNLYETVQKNIDAAKEDGADYIIALSHIGYREPGSPWDVESMIKSTSGLDVVLDAHSHSVIENIELIDKSGNEVVLTSTGTKFANIGKLTISNDEITTELIPTEGYTETNEKVDGYIAKINEEYSVLGNRKVGVSEATLRAFAEDGTRLIRNNETNLGNLCADAYRIVTGADIGYSNGGGIRADITTGDVTFNNLLSVFPYNNIVCVADVKGQIIKDMLELAMTNYPLEDGSFPHLSGVTFDMDASVPSSVKLDENQVFVSVDGEYRVRNIKVMNKESGTYEPLDLNKNYTFASHNYFLLEYGGGMSMFEKADSITDTGMLDIEVLEKYIAETLGGNIGKEYREVKPHINIIDEYIPLRKTFEAKGYEVIWTAEEPLKIVVNSDHCTYIFMANTNSVTVDGNAFSSDRMAYIENGTTYISADCLTFCELCAK